MRTMPEGKLYHVDAPHFCCGLIVQESKIVFAAPILNWTVGKEILWFVAYCQSKGWKISAS